MNQTYGYFANLGDVTVASLQNVWYKVLQYLPQLIGAIIILLIGWFIAKALGSLARKGVEATGVDAAVERSGLNERFKVGSRYKLLSRMVGGIVKWFIIVVALVAAAGVLDLPQINEFLNQVLLYIPRAVVAVVILTIGFLAGDFLGTLVEKALASSQLPGNQRRVIASVAKYSVMVFAVMAALVQLNIVPQLIEILFGGLMLALALAFGLGGREEAARFLAGFRRNTPTNNL